MEQINGMPFNIIAFIAGVIVGMFVEIIIYIVSTWVGGTDT